MRRLVSRMASGLTALAMVFVPINHSYAGTIGTDGGVTLWLSWADTSDASALIDDLISETNSSCGATNTGRSGVGAPAATAACPGGGSCTGREKLSADLERLADALYEATEGAHYLRRVYVADRSRAWTNADIRWDIASGSSAAWGGGWADVTRETNMRNTRRVCIGDVAMHEMGHYIYDLPDRYSDSGGYYQGTDDGGSNTFQVNVIERDVNTVMSNNFPHRFVDTTNARIRVTYDTDGPGGNPQLDEVLTPGLLSDDDASNDGPNRWHHNHSHSFAQDEWSLAPDRHADLTGVHTEGEFPEPEDRPALDVVFLDDTEDFPGTMLVLDRSGSMAVTTNGVPASQFVQEAGLYLYHTSEADEFAGTVLYNASVETLFDYELYDASNTLPGADFRTASGLTDIALALETAIDTLVDEHGEGDARGAEVYLMSDGKQTTGNSLWDQVERANELGIRINTFSFGDADEATMESIATGADGTLTPVSEKDDAEVLKQIMARRMSEGRGGKAVHVDRSPFNADTAFSAPGGDDLVFMLDGGSFVVPNSSNRLQFYTTIEGANAGSLVRIILTAPDGTVFEGSTTDPVAIRGRFAGITVNGPQPGVWKYALFPRGGDIGYPPEGDIERIALIENLQLSTYFDVGEPDADGNLPLLASAAYRYPLANIGVVAKLYNGQRLMAQVPLFDDGSSANDQQADDGEYTGLLTPAIFRKAAGRAGSSLRVEVEFSIDDATVKPAPFAHYETGTTLADLDGDFSGLIDGDFELYEQGLIRFEDFSPTDADDGPRFGEIDIDDNGSGGATITFDLYGTRPLISQMRVALGPNAKVDVNDAEPCPDASDTVLCTRFTGTAIPRDPSRPLTTGPLIVQAGGDRIAQPGGAGGDDHHDGKHPPKKHKHKHTHDDEFYIKISSNNPYVLYIVVGMMALIIFLLLIVALRLSARRYDR